jgi:hypothetical protein
MPTSKSGRARAAVIITGVFGSGHRLEAAMRISYDDNGLKAGT